MSYSWLPRKRRGSVLDAERAELGLPTWSVRALELRAFAGLPADREPVPLREPDADRELAADRELVVERELATEREPVAEREPVPVRAFEVALLAARFFGAPALAPRGPAARPLPEAMSSSISPSPPRLFRTRKGPVPPTTARALCNEYPGDVLLSQGAAPQVPSALAVLTSVFGMGTGVAPPLWSPGTFALFSNGPHGPPFLELSIVSTSGLYFKPSAD